MKVLITCGPTWVPIDGIRVISNCSTGEMGHALAKAFLKGNAQVTLVEGPVAGSFDTKGIRVIKYHFFDELKKILHTQARQGYGIIVHAAAVSDFKVKKPFKGKVDSSKPLSLDLVPTEKLITQIKRWAPRSVLVGFKLEPNMTRANCFGQTQALFEEARCDFAVANSIHKGYKGFILNPQGQILAEASDKNQMAKSLASLL